METFHHRVSKVTDELRIISDENLSYLYEHVHWVKKGDFVVSCESQLVTYYFMLQFM